ncbi:hypothetical protein UT300007_12600 [Clostridium sp. CTA-7]
MKNYNKVIIDKNFLKKVLSDRKDLAESLSRFVENSIIARRFLSTKDNPCEVRIQMFGDLIEITDNSGGVDPILTDKEIFRFGLNIGEEISCLGIKKSLFELGNEIKIFSNNEICSKEFILDLKIDSVELYSDYKEIEFNSNMIEGTKINISDLDKRVKDEIDNENNIKITINKLGRIFSKFIQKNELILKVNSEIVKANDIIGQKVASGKLLENYEVDLFKALDGEVSGVDLFINDFMIYNRVKNNSFIRWNLLNHTKHRFGDCIVEVRYYGDKTNFELDQEKLITELIKFIKEHKGYFQSKIITIQYEIEIDKVEALKEYYDEDTAKSIGIIAFTKLYEDYVNTINKKLY